MDTTLSVQRPIHVAMFGGFYEEFEHISRCLFDITNHWCQ